jgi:hypothetical protein
MKIREILEESKAPSVGVCYGRWNPPHKGHVAAWETAAKCDHFYVGTNQNTQGPKDPLPYDVKVMTMETICPNTKGHIVSEQNLFTLAAEVYKKHGSKATLKVCTDEGWLAESLQKYNGVQAKHGYYNFASIEQVRTPRLGSATALRSAVADGLKEEFSQAAGVPADTLIEVNGKSVKFFELVSKYLKEHIK